MEIKGPSPNRPPANPADTRTESARPAKSFSADAVSEAGLASSPSQLRRVAEAFRKADLADPAKVDNMVAASVRELVSARAETMGGLPEADRARIEQFMQGDPVIRNTIMKYLEKVLS